MFFAVALMFIAAVLIAAARQKRLQIRNRKYFILDDHESIVGTVECGLHDLIIRTQTETREYDVLLHQTDDLYNLSGQKIFSWRQSTQSGIELTEFADSKSVRTLRLKAAFVPKELSGGNAYEILTRSALLQFCEAMPPGKYAVMFLQFGKSGLASDSEEIDSRICSVLRVSVGPNDVVARWKSGEIVILLEYGRGLADERLFELEDRAHQGGLSFRCNIGTWEAGRTNIEEIIKWLRRRGQSEFMN